MSIKKIIQPILRMSRSRYSRDQTICPNIEPIKEYKVGFWPDPYWSGPHSYPLAQSLVVPGWNNTKEGRACISYMKAGLPYNPQRGYAYCRLCRARLGSSDMLGPDGKWVYPERWEHYIEKHSVKPDEEEFVRDAARLFWKYF